MEKIFIKEEINSSLEFNDSALDFLEKINKKEDKYIEVDFTGIIFISRSFAQAYFFNKNKLNKTIIEVNVPENIKFMLDMIRSKFE